MNYKTVMICAMLTGSMQDMWGMEEDKCAIALKNQLEEWYSLGAYGSLAQLIVSNEKAYAVIDREKLAIVAEKTQSLELLKKSEHGMKDLKKIEAQCSQKGIDIRTDPAFKEIAEKITNLLAENREGDDCKLMEIGFRLGDLVKDLKEIYIQRIREGSEENNHQHGAAKKRVTWEVLD